MKTHIYGSAGSFCKSVHVAQQQTVCWCEHAKLTLELQFLCCGTDTTSQGLLHHAEFDQDAALDVKRIF